VKLRATFLPLLLAALPLTASAQIRPKISVAIEARSEGRPDGDATTGRLLEEIRRGLSAIPDVEIAPRDVARRTIWLVTGSAPGATAASLMVTEHYDRETLMVLGIEDDDMAHRMMALQIVSDHQIFTGRDAADVGARIVKALDAGVFTRLRALPPRP
jgi:hypothetical protein